ncbi:ArsR/SmtB family transcription factor [Thalassotalea piscium]|uniref:DNA-binding transcriptional ArsR family regulator n=1 Tax=Thalassotalea piscium TaxID=1230533 RepID=A0A7X0NEJ3_9GAMM|nr:metalloregulator ArsR/SmtB family transcription factor [Thalassotalea piscium]MBB6541955.1 DNA-binding transcriptional ArsR family regulator [Thalassotalea piscium]
MNIKPSELSKNAKEVATILKLLSNHYRLMILCCLADGELTVGDLNKQVDLSQSALSQHLTKLRESGLVETRRESQTIYYRVDNAEIKGLLFYLQQQFCNSPEGNITT